MTSFTHPPKDGRSGANAPSGCRPSDGANSSVVSTADAASIPNALAGADDWEVGPCVNTLGHVTSWDISLPRDLGAKGVAVVASVYSGEATARAILAAIHAAASEARRAALTRMVQLDEELGLYDDDEPIASAMSAGTAETPQSGSGRQPASAVRDSADAPTLPGEHS